MAKVIAPFKLRGSIGDLTFYENEFGPQAKPKGRPTEWHIKNQDSFKRALRYAAEWKRATAAAKLFRAAIGSLLNGVKNIRLSGRMNAPMVQAVHADPVHDWGERMISFGNLLTLVDFEFNHKLSLDDALPLNVENCYTIDADKVWLQIPAFRLRKKKGLPPGATHYRLVSGVVTVDFDKQSYHRDIQEGPLQAMGRKAGEAFCVEHALTAATPGCFWLLGIEFYTMEKDKPKLIKGGALRVMQWWGTAREETVVQEEGAVMTDAAVQKDELVKEEPAVKEELSVTEEGVPEKLEVKEEPGVAPLAATTPTPTTVVQFNYVSNGQQNGNVVYQVGQQGWYGTSSAGKQWG
jgi:hypothetical protein